MGPDFLDGAAFGFVLVVQDIVVRAVDVLEARRRAWIEETPLRIVFDAFHEEVRDPEGVEEIARAEVLVALVAFEVEDLEDIGVVRLDVDRAAALPFPGLVDVPEDFVRDLEHRHETVARPVGRLDQRPLGSDGVDVEADAAAILADRCRFVERFKDAVQRVVVDAR